MKTPNKIGLTGGIGSGKTTVSKIFHSLGVPIFNSDECGKQLLLENGEVIKNVIKIFGKKIIKKKKIDIQKLSEIIFSNKKNLESINHIIHPQVGVEFNKWLAQHNNNYIIKESALLFESKTHHLLDKIILVKAPIKMRIKRVLERDARTELQIKKIIAHQLKTRDVIKRADYIINNNEKTLLTPKIIQLHNQLSQL